MPAPSTEPAAEPSDEPAGIDPHLGVVAGEIARTTARLSLPGLPILAAAATVTVAAVASRALTGRISGGVLAAGMLGPVLLVGAAWLARRVVDPGDRRSVAWRFRVQPATGMGRTYLLEGDVPPGALRTGDLVRVNEGRTRVSDSGPETVARSVDVLATLDGPVIRAVVGRRALAVRGFSGGCVVLAVLMLAAAVLVFVGGTR
jgi:hypothetical protein